MPVFTDDVHDRLVSMPGVPGLHPIRDIPLGKEFVEGGRLYQTSASPSRFGVVPLKGRFKSGDKWYARIDGSGRAVELHPNMPFGRPSHVRQTFHTSSAVRILELDERRPAPP